MSNERDLMALGFEPDDDGSELLAPSDSLVGLTPIDRQCYRLKIYLADGTTVACVVSARAIRIEPAERQPRVRVIYDEDEDDDAS